MTIKSGLEKQKLQSLIELASILKEQNDFQEILRIVAHKSAQFLDADLALVLMINPDTRETIKTLMRGGRQVTHKEYRSIHIHIGGWIIKHHKAFFSDNLSNDDRFAKSLFEDTPLTAVLGAPLVIAGRTIGAILLLYEKPSVRITRDSLAELEAIASISVPFLRNMQKIKQFFETVLPEETLLTKYKKAGLLGKSQKFRELLHAIEAASRCEVRVLLEGRTGTGKELIARAIHQFSSRSNQPFVAIDCGAIPHNLIESELFGHKRGAFTGASYDRKGLFSEATGGTLFIDEITNLPLEMQSKLMRVLQEGELRPLGSNKSIKVDVRIIAASSTSLKQLVEEHKFREDLYFRVHVYPIWVPDLEERRDDIPLLAHHFLSEFGKQQKKRVSMFHEELMDFLKNRFWPGNIRELENVVERLVTMTPPEVKTIDAEMLPPDLAMELKEFRLQRNRYNRESLKEQVQRFEATIIRQTLKECDWNQTKAARQLQTSEKNIRYKMQTLNIKKPVSK